MRVHKVCLTLSEQGYDVLLIGRKLKFSKKIDSRKYKTKRMKLIFEKGFLFYAEFNFRLLWFLLFNRSNILLSNDLDTLLPNFLISKVCRKKLVYDSHEYFTEVPELVNRKFTQSVWLRIEKFILPKLTHCYTVCQSIADIYEQKYGTKFQVVRNIPICETEKVRIPTKEKSDKKIIIYQGAINVGRGIEDMLKAMLYLDNHIFWIIGDGDVFPEIEKLVIDLSLEKRVKMFGKLPFSQLKKHTQKADLGISFEKNMGLNYYFALPNKLFDYINAEIPILASPFPEMKRIIDNYKIGAYLQSRQPKILAKQISEILENTNQLKIWKQNLKIAKSELCWQNEAKILKQIFEEK